MGWLAKCLGEGCCIRDGCKRFTDPATDMQSWIVTPPKTGVACDKFEPVVDEEDGS